jgi:hypothetical protein
MICAIELLRDKHYIIRNWSLACTFSEKMTSGAAEYYTKTLLCRITNRRAELPRIMSFGKLLTMCSAPLEILRTYRSIVGNPETADQII